MTVYWLSMYIYTKDEFIQSVLHEMRVINHLVSKMPADHAEYRPSDAQRSTLELLQYLSYISSSVAEAILTDDLSHFALRDEESKLVTLETFAAAMEAEQARFLEIMERFTEEDMGKIINLFRGGDKTKGAYLVDGVLKIITGYKLQLFLYVKTINPAIGTSNAWGGFDMPAKAE